MNLVNSLFRFSAADGGVPSWAWKWPALAWGFAEATFFFIVPDVFLTYIALKDWRQATRACFWALGGALVGGAVMYAWGALDMDSAEDFLETVPAVNYDMLKLIESQVESDGSQASLSGRVTGPYKIYGAYAGAAGVNLFTFLLISIPARLLVFLLTTWFFAAVFNFHFVYRSFDFQSPLKKLSPRGRMILLSVLWIAFYSWYFTVEPLPLERFRQ